MSRKEQSFSENDIKYLLDKIKGFPILLEVYGESGRSFDTWDGFRILAEGEDEIEKERKSILPNCDSETNWDIIAPENLDDLRRQIFAYQDLYTDWYKKTLNF